MSHFFFLFYLPLGSYSKCIEYENSYFASMQAGRHYYEGKPKDFFSDWNHLPSLTPESHINYELIPQKLKEQLEEGLKVYETAKSTGLLKGDNVCTFDDESKAALAAAVELAKKAIDNQKAGNQMAKVLCAKAAQSLQAALTNMKSKLTGYVLPHGSQADNETIERVRKDFFVMSPALQEMMKEDFGAVEGAKAVFEELKQVIADAGKGDKVIEEFCHALFAGIFEFKPLQITYHKEEFGIPSDEILSKMGPDFPYCKVPLYQAFVSYKAMESDERQKIAQDADNMINNMDPCVLTTMTELKTRLNPQYNATMANNASSYAEYDEIVTFLKRVNSELAGLAGMFGI